MTTLSAGETYYNSYVTEATRENVAPIVAERGKWVPNLDGETWETPRGREALSHRWGDPAYGPVYVSVSNMGRVMEVQSIMRGMSHICAVHRSKDDYYAYRRPMSVNMYLWG